MADAATMRAFLGAHRHVVVDALTGQVFEVVPDEKLGKGNSHFEYVGTIPLRDVDELVARAKRGK